MSKNKQTVQTLFKVGFIFGLIFGILSAIGLVITIIGLAFGVLCIISAVMSKKLSQQEEWAQALLCHPHCRPFYRQRE